MFFKREARLTPCDLGGVDQDTNALLIVEIATTIPRQPARSVGSLASRSVFAPQVVRVHHKELTI